MKKIINGKRYDTDTAEFIGRWENIYNSADLQYECEELYKKKTGEFFMYGEGGPASSYAVQTGSSSWSGSEKITPVTINEAKKWAEENLDADEYEKIFEIEEEGNIAFSLLIPENLYNRLKKESEKTEKSMKDIIVEALESKLDQ